MYGAMSQRERVVLVVLDGVGIAPDSDRNAFTAADTPVLDELFGTYPYTELSASGPAVGLPDGYMGNSEVGHLHIGAGRIVEQHLLRINRAINDGSLFDRDAVRDTVDHVRETGGTIHLLGLASDGGVHAHIDHLCALLRFFGEQNVDVVTHAVLDGRDVPPESAEQYLAQIEDTAAAAGTGHIGSFMGRFYAMDRDENWDRTRNAYDLLVSGDSRTAHSISDGMHTARNEDRNDYFVFPTVIGDRFVPVGDGDAVICTNFRKDRMRQLAAAFTSRGFDAFPTAHPDSVRFVSMTPYGSTFTNPYIMEEITVEQTLGEVISGAGLSQLRLTESQKAPHVTYFFDGQRETTLSGEDRCIIPSADVTAYDETPAMAAEQITDRAVDALEQDAYAFILINYPNGDLVGHTGDMDATVTAIETVDTCVGRMVNAAQDAGYTPVITADHGNCETMMDDSVAHTAHTENDVPFCIVADDGDLPAGTYGLSRVAPTVLDLLNVAIPDEMEASLLDG